MEKLIFPIAEKHQEYLIDESKTKGFAESISFPKTEAEIVAVVKQIQGAAGTITIQGGKTGIVAGAVPNGGHILNLSEMTACVDSQLLADGTGRITVQPGMNLLELNLEINRRFKKEKMIWPLQPTEETATVGGVVASGANGIHAYYYGEIKPYVEAVRLVKANGEVVSISRSEAETELDLMIGGEGIYGVISEVTLKLIPKPEEVWGISFFFTALNEISAFTEKLAELEAIEGAYITAAEYIGREALDLIEARKANMTKIKELPAVDERFAGLIYLELAGAEAMIEGLAECLMEAAMECGSDPDDAWAVIGEAEVEKMHVFRHAAAETANLSIEEARRTDERIKKLGTDMMLRGKSFDEVVTTYQEDLKAAGLQGSVFGHLLGNHLHVNILPKTYAEYESGRALIEQWSECICREQGKIVTEHGVGKLKAHLLDLAYPKEHQQRMKECKKKYDPQGLFNCGNIFAEGR